MYSPNWSKAWPVYRGNQFSTISCFVFIVLFCVQMFALNLPEFEVNLKKSEGKVWIFDGIRKKYIVLTPEEWVRQHLIQYFINQLKYPKSLIQVERGLHYNQLQKR